MDVVAVGVGGAGGRIVDELSRDDAERPVSYLAATHAFDTDTDSLETLDRVPQAARHSVGTLEFGGSGTDGDREAAAEAMAEQATEMRREIDGSITTNVTGIVLVAGLGGGVGAGATPVLARELCGIYDRPVYCISVLPTTDSEVAAENAARALDTLDDVVDCQIAFDNEAWVRSGETIEERIPALNRELVDRVGSLLLAGEVDPAGGIGESVLDETDVAATLDAGGLATIGYASAPVARFREFGDGSVLGRLRGKLFGSASDIEKQEAVRSTLRWAARGKLTLECELDAVGSALLLFSGPPEWLNRGAIADGRDWVAAETGSAELRSGDAPLPGTDSLSVLVVFAGIQSAPRIEELQWY